MSVNFSIPAIMDEKFPLALRKALLSYGQNGAADRVVNVYGSLPRNVLGHARSPDSIPDVDMDFLSTYIQKMSEINVEFHYTINSPWSGGIERTRAGQKAIIEELNELTRIGVRAFIISNPYLIRLVRTKLPDAGITASTNMRSDSVPLVEELLNLGADSVVLNKRLNRDFGMLREISKKYGDKITVLVNSTCLWECPLYDYHSLETGFVSRFTESKDHSVIVEPDFCFNYCLDRYLEEPWNLIKSQWILPEHIEYYHQLGIKNFKIQGRSLKLEDAMKLINGYVERRTPDGSLFGIWPGFQNALASRANALSESTDVKNIPVKTIVESDFLNMITSNNRPCSWGCSECTLCHGVYHRTQKAY